MTWNRSWRSSNIKDFLVSHKVLKMNESSFSYLWNRINVFLMRLFLGFLNIAFLHETRKFGSLSVPFMILDYHFNTSIKNPLK